MCEPMFFEYFHFVGFLSRSLYRLTLKVVLISLQFIASSDYDVLFE